MAQESNTFERNKKEVNPLSDMWTSIERMRFLDSESRNALTDEIIEGRLFQLEEKGYTDYPNQFIPFTDSCIDQYIPMGVRYQTYPNIVGVRINDISLFKTAIDKAVLIQQQNPFVRDNLMNFFPQILQNTLDSYFANYFINDNGLKIRERFYTSQNKRVLSIRDLRDNGYARDIENAICAHALAHFFGFDSTLFISPKNRNASWPTTIYPEAYIIFGNSDQRYIYDPTHPLTVYEESYPRMTYSSRQYPFYLRINSEDELMLRYGIPKRVITYDKQVPCSPNQLISDFHPTERIFQ